MKSLSYLFLFAVFSATILAEDAIDTDRAANTVILDEIGVKNLRIEMVPVSEETFESTVFAIGRIEEIPVTRSALSSRIAGRIVELNAYIGDEVKAGQVLAKVESRQPGNPPPTIEIRALQGGTVVDSHSRIGEPVQPDSDLLDISDRSKLWAVAKIPEPEASEIVPGTKARILVPALGNEVIEAKLARFGVEANREAGTIEGIFEIDNSNGKLQPGMRVEFSLITGVRKDVMSVPKSAVQGDPTKRVVFVEDFELPNAFVKAPVVLGEQNDTHVEVISGLFPGDEVVTRGSYSLSFAGSGSGMSLKEALDAAHGHEHNEDGSEMSAEQKAAEEATKRAASGGGSLPLWAWLVAGWAVIATIIMLILAQSLLKLKRTA
ncbi:MAG: efflux RND transporter periplasmic adaptor subunit [Verrucomicrobiales bacterium]|jgi:multidrug efflux pump subunit AcrA (membrane-fusion protein)|nr:efflux RND transporter periplasmic adaptor subunit [Verrucomicrobiales bacterium]